jgi:hypothetical protein
VAALIKTVIPLTLVGVASEKSITRACLAATTGGPTELAAGKVITFIQKVIVKLVEPKYVPVGSVRKLMY